MTPITNPAPAITSPATSGASWCVATQSAPQKELQVALDYACGYGGVDCSVIQPTGSCYNPSTIRDHASYAFNAYYQKNPVPNSCNFGGTAMITSTDPSKLSPYCAISLCHTIIDYGNISYEIHGEWLLIFNHKTISLRTIIFTRTKLYVVIISISIYHVSNCEKHCVHSIIVYRLILYMVYDSFFFN